ncbi:hypothetical protein [Streptomyces yanii]|uniref:Uncharacterized protein n=1 Tax=Streptomyces yanii TaxID=78510 RepID=A0ABV5RJS2_9ACTN
MPAQRWCATDALAVAAGAVPGGSAVPGADEPDRLLPRLMGKPMKQHPEPLVRYA